MILCVGDTVFWNDPDCELCSDWVEIVEIRDLEVIVRKNGGAEFEVFPSELSHNTPEEEEEEEEGF